MRLSLALNRMTLPPPISTRTDHESSDMHRDARRSPAAISLRAKVVLTAVALVAAVVLVAVASWPLKVLVVLAFVRGLFASDLIAFRDAPRSRGSNPTVETVMVPGDG